MDNLSNKPSVQDLESVACILLRVSQDLYESIKGM